MLSVGPLFDGCQGPLFDAHGRSHLAQSMNMQVGLVAINDGIILESCIYRILQKHFKGQPYYVSILELFHEVTYQTSHGQLMDLITAPIGTVPDWIRQPVRSQI
jgi:Polyprenyl synthetase